MTQGLFDSPLRKNASIFLTACGKKNIISRIQITYRNIDNSKGMFYRPNPYSHLTSLQTRGEHARETLRHLVSFRVPPWSFGNFRRVRSHPSVARRRTENINAKKFERWTWLLKFKLKWGVKELVQWKVFYLEWVSMNLRHTIWAFYCVVGARYNAKATQ